MVTFAALAKHFSSTEINMQYRGSWGLVKFLSSIYCIHLLIAAFLLCYSRVV